MIFRRGVSGIKKGNYLGFNEYKVVDNYVIVYLRLRAGEQYETYVDLEDLQRLKDFGYHWHLSWNKKGKCYYCKCTIRSKDIEKYNRRSLYLHSYIMGLYKQVDHINHNTLDNRKENLRVLTKDENNLYRKGANCNSVTGYRNVSYIKDDKKKPYHVQLQVDGKNTVLGKFFIWKKLHYLQNK